MKQWVILIFSFSLIVAMPFAYAQQGSIELKSEAFKETAVKNSKGETEYKLVYASESLMVPKDEVYYVTTFTNIGDQPAGDIVITDPVPNNSIYKANSAFGAGTDITFSADGGKTYAPANQLKINEGGSERAAKPEEYTHIRWVYTAQLAPKAEATVSFRTIIK